MGEDFIGRQIERTNRNLFLFGIVVLAILGTVCAFSWRDIYNHCFGPFAADAQQLAAISSATSEPRYYVKVQGDKIFSTTFQEVDAGNQSRINAEFEVLTIGDRLLLVKTPSASEQLFFKGTLNRIPTELQKGIVQKWDAKHPEAQGAFFPYVLDATGIWDNDSVISAIFGTLFAALGVWLVVMPLRRWSQPASHPLLKKLQAYGLVNDVCMRIDSEMRSEGGGERFGRSLHITTNWVLHAQAMKTEVMQVRDVLWAFPKVTKHYHNGIPTGKTYSAILRDAKGQSIEVSGKKNTVPQLLQTLQQRMPWLLVGFTKELDVLWQKQKPKFYQLMEQRRAKLAMATR